MISDHKRGIKTIWPKLKQFKHIIHSNTTSIRYLWCIFPFNPNSNCVFGLCRGWPFVNYWKLRLSCQVYLSQILIHSSLVRAQLRLSIIFSRYRPINAGKFPSVTEALKEVGGSFYVVKKALQELEYKPNVCSSNSSYENSSAKVVNKEDKSFSVVEVVSTGVRVQDATCAKAVNDVKILDTNDKQLEADRGSCPDFVLEENSVLKFDAKAKGLEGQADDKVETVGIDSADKFQMFLNKQKNVKATNQDLESEELGKTEFWGVQMFVDVIACIFIMTPPQMLL
ncbi:uncharacterized protein LOC120210748 [Hibiscus syriacus]|uniref:uncharacterized protein LOC120210748 n=1 Tax=Hibiscus syriacus TaxID=106335 RepID=UPI0019249AB2|nr:uncharacterized protein LOC120210748 [Hibiscus syriacus]